MRLAAITAGASSASASDRVFRSERVLSQRLRLFLLLGLCLGFVVFRWVQRLEPWNSDDMDLFQFSVEAASGQHWVFGTPAGGAALASQPVPHTAFRIGLLPATVLAIKAVGATANAYYLVPLFFSLCGFGVLYWVLLRHFGPLVALVFAAIHVAWPFELQHASVLLTDLPAAVAALVSLCLLDASARQGRRGRLLFAALAGLAAWETYLLRNNGLVLLAPAYLPFLWSRATRQATLVAGAVIVLGVLGQQAFLVYRGFSWGYDWSSVRSDFAEYAQFLPVYSWPAFLVRQFTYQLSTFGRGVTGILAALLVAGSLLLHLAMLRWERRVLLLSITVFGLLAWLVFSFSIYERVPGGVRAMVPVNFRFIQPFAYSSLVAWAWAWCALRKARPWASAGLPLVLITFSCVASAFHLPTYRQGATRRLVRAIERQLARSDQPLKIAGSSWSLQVPRAFCCAPAAPRVEWSTLSPRELAELIEHKSGALVLRDVPRELELARYFAPAARTVYRAQLARLEESLWRDYELAYVDGKYALFDLPRSGDPRVSDVRASARAATAAEAPGADLLTAPACGTPAEGESNARLLLPPQAGRQRASCELAWPADSLVLAALEPPLAPAAGSGLVLRVSADYEPPLSLSVDVVEHSASGVRRQRSTLPPGTSYVPVPLQAGVRSLAVVYRATTRGALALPPVRLAPVQWRPQQLLDAEIN